MNGSNLTMQGVRLSHCNMNNKGGRLTKEWVSERLPERPKEANKGTFGKVLIIAGSESYVGAAYLSAAAAYRVGAGLVTLATTSTVQNIVGKKLPEVTFLILPEEKGGVGSGAYEFIAEKLIEYDVLLIGPGLGQTPQTGEFVEQLLKTKVLPKTVIDGDGLNILSNMKEWWKGLTKEAVLTPHPGEMFRLTKLSVDEIQKNRINIAKRFSKEWSQVVVLKGANTIIASPAGEIMESQFVNPGLATAGTGDVLAGIISGMLAQGLEPFNAAGVGVYIHGLAGEELKEKIGNAGILASDLLPILPQVLRNLV